MIKHLLLLFLTWQQPGNKFLKKTDLSELEVFLKTYDSLINTGRLHPTPLI
jgi:hypothetical protein